MKKLRVLVLMHKDLMPPEQVNGHDVKAADWRTEYGFVFSDHAWLGEDLDAMNSYHTFGAGLLTANVVQLVEDARREGPRERFRGRPRLPRDHGDDR